MYRKPADVPKAPEDPPKFWVLHTKIRPTNFGEHQMKLSQIQRLAGLPQTPAQNYDYVAEIVSRGFDTWDEAAEYISSMTRTTGLTEYQCYYGYRKIVKTEVEVITEKRVTFKNM